MMVTFTKLLAIKMVASVRSLSSRSSFTCWSVGVFSSSISAKSVGERLKNAISEPLAKPDTNNNNAASTAAKTTPIVIGWNTTRSLMFCKLDKSKAVWF